MNGLDIAIILLLLLPAAFGFRKGLIGTIFVLGGVVGGLLLARMFNEPVASFLARFIDNESFQTLGAFTIVITVSVVTSWAASKLFKGVLSFLLLGWIDNIAGTVVGAFVGAAIGTGIILILGVLSNELAAESILAPTLKSAFGWLVEFILGNVKDLTSR
ncbi:MAG: CvpA family protein [SAR202 cluster bacterium]|nr:CvpA family protein [SAR202 cluster bacterium]|tara:strand:- start:6537 stop:7016 length:480 start_codon:yes stop_codon:yes gene_type:complete